MQQLLDPAAASAAQRFVNQTGSLADALSTLPNPALADPERTTRVLRTVGQSFHNFSLVAKREAELRAELTGVPDVVVRVPGFEHDISDVDALAAITRVLYTDT